MGNDIGFFRDDLNGHVAAEKSPDGVAEDKSVVGRVAVEPNGPRTSQKHHAVGQTKDQERPAEILKQKYQERHGQSDRKKPEGEGQPIPAVREYIQPGKKFLEDFFWAGFVKPAVSFKAIRRWV